MTIPAPTARRIDAPVAALMRKRLVKGGPYVACRIVRLCACTPVGGDEQAEHEHGPDCDRAPPLQAEINGRIDERPDAVDRLWTSAEIIDADEWRLMTERREWDAQHAPDAPSQRPRDAIDPLTSKLAF